VHTSARLPKFSQCLLGSALFPTHLVVRRREKGHHLNTLFSASANTAKGNRHRSCARRHVESEDSTVPYADFAARFTTEIASKCETSSAKVKADFKFRDLADRSNVNAVALSLTFKQS
jgi:hypothetical protein